MTSKHIYQISLLLLLTISCHKQKLYHPVSKSGIKAATLYDDTQSDIDYVMGCIKNKNLKELEEFLGIIDDVAEIINGRDSNQQLPLEVALEIPQEVGEKMALLLIDCGANVSANILTYDGYEIPLVNVAFVNQYNVAQEMMLRGATLNLGKFKSSPYLKFIKAAQQQTPQGEDTHFLPSEEILAVIDRKSKALNAQQKGILVNLLDNSSGVSPLGYCVAMGDTSMAQGLIDRGANVDSRNSVKAQEFADYTPFMIAAERQDEAMMRLLVQHGADVNKGTSSATKKYSALHKAVTSKDIEQVRRIIRVGGERINLNVKDNRGRRPIMCAADLNFEEAVRYLTDLSQLKEDNPSIGVIAAVHVVDNFKCNLLHYAASTENLALIKYCKEALGVASSQEDIMGITPLHIALRGGGKEAVGYLLDKFSEEEIKRLYDYEKGALAQSKDPKFPLMYIVALKAVNKDGDLVKLLSQKIAINTKYSGAIGKASDRLNNVTVAHIAAHQGHLQVLERLHEAGAKLSEKDAEGYTPLMVAAKKGFLAIVDYLFFKVGDKVEQALAFREAVKHKNSQIRDCILEKHSDKNMLLIPASAFGEIAIVEKLLAENVAINTKNQEQKTALEAAFENDQIAVALLLLDRGARIDASMIYRIAERGQDELLAKIKEQNKLDIRDKAGNTAFLKAVENTCQDVAKRLLRHNADATLRNNQDLGAIELAWIKRSKALYELVGDIGMCSEDSQHGSSIRRGIDILKDFMHVLLYPNDARSLESFIREGGREKLIDVAGSGCLNAAKVLLKLGVDPNCFSLTRLYLFKASPIMCATMNKNPAMIRLLLENGADINQKNSRGWTALTYASRSSWSDKRLADLLRSYGAKDLFKGEVNLYEIYIV